MGNAALKPGAAADVDVHWRSFPRGTKHLFDKYRGRLHSVSTFVLKSVSDDQRDLDRMTTFSSGDKARDGLDLVINFIVLSSQLFLEDREYEWDLPRALKSAYILAADSLIQRRLGATTLLLLYSAFLEECLSRGFEAVTGCWAVHPGDVIVRLTDAQLFSDLAHLRSAVVSSRTTTAISEFLTERLAEYPGTRRWLRRLEQRERLVKDLAAIHTFDVSGAVPEPLVKITCRAGLESVEMLVYGETKLKWVIQRCLASTQGAADTKLFNGTRRLSSKRWPCLRLWDIDSERVLNMASAGEKTLSELRVKGGDSFLLIHDNMPIAPIQGTKCKRAGTPLTSLSKIACCSARP